MGRAWTLREFRLVKAAPRSRRPVAKLASVRPSRRALENLCERQVKKFCTSRHRRLSKPAMATPSKPKIYHIVHIDRLASIAQHGIFSDAVRRRAQGIGTVIGMETIKDRRLHLPVSCHAGTVVGDYVPFYFCSRSIMLYVIHCANHPELAYRGGQAPIVHLEADLHEVVEWANGASIRWAFTSANAGAYYTPFFNTVADLDELNWDGIAARDFRPPDVKEAKQSEFLVHHSFPWHLIRRIGVLNLAVANQVHALCAELIHRPTIEIQPSWYY
jgi:hypothetical protein